MSTVLIHADVQAHTVAEGNSDLVSREELPVILASYNINNTSAKVITTNYQIAQDDSTLLVNGAITVTLPDAALVPNKVYNIKRISVAGPVTISTSAGNLIDGNSSVQLTSMYASLSVISVNSQWWIF